MMCKVLSDLSGASVFFNDSFPVCQSQYWVSVSDTLPVCEHFLLCEGQHPTVGPEPSASTPTQKPMHS